MAGEDSQNATVEPAVSCLRSSSENQEAGKQILPQLVVFFSMTDFF